MFLFNNWQESCRRRYKRLKGFERRLCDRFATAGEECCVFFGQMDLKCSRMCLVDKKDQTLKWRVFFFFGVVKEFKKSTDRGAEWGLFQKGERAGGVQLDGLSTTRRRKNPCRPPKSYSSWKFGWFRSCNIVDQSPKPKSCNGIHRNKIHHWCSWLGCAGTTIYWQWIVNCNSCTEHGRNYLWSVFLFFPPLRGNN